MARTWWRGKGGSTSVALRKLLDQRLGLLEVSSIEPLGEPVIDRCQQLIGLSALALLLPQACLAHRSPQLPGLGLLAVRDSQGLLKTDCCLVHIRDGLA